MVKIVVELELLLDAGKGVKEELADISEEGSVADRKAVLRDSSEELAENEVNIGGGEKIAGERGGDFRAELIRFEELLLGAGVEGAKQRMIAAEHATAAAVSEGELKNPKTPRR